MDKYETIKAVGDGSFGSVTKARNKFSNEIVAIKRMKAQFASWDEAMKLREVKSLRKLNHHNVVKLKEVIRQQDSLFFVFEFMEKNMYELLSKNGTAPTESEIRRMAYDSIQGVAACHKNGYFHRDLKPENFLINHDQVVKLADFGLAKEIRSRPPHTEYVSTRWYRAPELLLQSPNYNSPIDIFAMGCILTEMFLLRPLAPGNSEADQLMKLCLVLGTPPMDWTEGYQLAAQRRIDFPRCPVTPLESIIPNAGKDAIDLILKMLQWDPQKRPTASQCLQHPFFTHEVRQEHSRKLQANMQSDVESARGKPPTGGAGFMQLRNSQNKGLQQKQMSVSVLTPLNNNASVGAINDYSSKVPSLGPEQNGNSVFSSHKGSLIAREGQPGNQSNLNLRSNKSGLHQTNNVGISPSPSPMGVTAQTKPWEQQNTNGGGGGASIGTTQLGDSYGASYLRSSNPSFSQFDAAQKNQNNNRAGVGGSLYSNNSLKSGQKILIAPKLQGSLAKGGLGSSSGIGSSSILSLPVLGQENQLQPTNRNLKGNDSQRQLLRNEESKINQTAGLVGGSSSGPGNPVYFSRPSNQAAASTQPEQLLSPNSKKDKSGISQTSRNMSVLNMKKSQARFLSPINGNEQAAPGQGGLGMGGATAINVHKMPSSLIEKYPTTSKGEQNGIVMPRQRNESKNNQLFDSYLNRQQQSHRKASIEMPSPIGSSSKAAAAAMNIENQAQGGSPYDFALPSLAAPSPNQHASNSSNKFNQVGGPVSMAPPIGQASGRNNMQNGNFSSQQRRGDPARASISDSDFDF